jgi:hypothetical protein
MTHVYVGFDHSGPVSFMADDPECRDAVKWITEQWRAQGRRVEHLTTEEASRWMQ